MANSIVYGIIYYTNGDILTKKFKDMKELYWFVGNEGDHVERYEIKLPISQQGWGYSD